jgi:hypothetical protein
MFAVPVTAVYVLVTDFFVPASDVWGARYTCLACLLQVFGVPAIDVWCTCDA